MVHNNNHVNRSVPLKLTCLANAWHPTGTPAIEMQFKSWNDRDRRADDRTGNRITFSRHYDSNARIMKCAGSRTAVTVTALFGRDNGKNIMIDFLINEESFMLFFKYVVLFGHNSCYGRMFWCFLQKFIADYFEPKRATVTASIGDRASLRYKVKNKGGEFQIKRFPDNGEQATFRLVSYDTGNENRDWGVEFAPVTAADEGFYTSRKSDDEKHYDGFTRLIVRGVSTEFPFFY